MGNCYHRFFSAYNPEVDIIYRTNFTGNVPECLKKINGKIYTMNGFVMQFTGIVNNLPSIERMNVLRYMYIDEDQTMIIPLHNNAIIILPECYPDIFEEWINNKRMIYCRK